jgi:hypothetical protein
VYGGLLSLGIFSIADLADFENVFWCQSEIGRAGKILVWNLGGVLIAAIPSMAGNLSPFLRRVVFVGEPALGERKAIVEAEDWEGPDFKTCANAANVARAFETSRRRKVLSFSHHAEVAALPALRSGLRLATRQAGVPESLRPVSPLADRREAIPAEGWARERAPATPPAVDRDKRVAWPAGVSREPLGGSAM